MVVLSVGCDGYSSISAYKSRSSDMDSTAGEEVPGEQVSSDGSEVPKEVYSFVLPICVSQGVCCDGALLLSQTNEKVLYKSINNAVA